MILVIPDGGFVVRHGNLTPEAARSQPGNTGVGRTGWPIWVLSDGDRVDVGEATQALQTAQVLILEDPRPPPMSVRFSRPLRVVRDSLPTTTRSSPTLASLSKPFRLGSAPLTLITRSNPTPARWCYPLTLLSASFS